MSVIYFEFWISQAIPIQGRALVAVTEGHHQMLSGSLRRNERQIGHVKAMPHANGQTREPPTKPPAARRAGSRFATLSIRYKYTKTKQRNLLSTDMSKKSNDRLRDPAL